MGQDLSCICDRQGCLPAPAAAPEPVKSSFPTRWADVIKLTRNPCGHTGPEWIAFTGECRCGMFKDFENFQKRIYMDRVFRPTNIAFSRIAQQDHAMVYHPQRIR